MYRSNKESGTDMKFVWKKTPQILHLSINELFKRPICCNIVYMLDLIFKKNSSSAFFSFNIRFPF